jgi:peptide/nickel transport system substrate-binding protein
VNRAALALALAAALGAAPAAAGVRPAWGGTIRIGVPAVPAGAPGATSPAGSRGAPHGELDDLVERATAAPLLEVDGGGALAPGALAEVPVPEAGARAFRLRVRPGLFDASGRPLGAADVAARIAALLAPGERSPDAWAALPFLGADALLEGRAAVLAGVQILSSTELLVSLAFPLPELPWLLAAQALALPGAGPFTLASRGEAARRPGSSPGSPVPGDAAALVRNDRHHRGRPFASEVRIETVDARAAARRLDQGGLELVLRPEAAGRAAISLAPLTVTVAALQGPRLGAAAAAVRAGLAAVDRTELARRFVRGPAEPLATLVPPAILPGAAAEDPPAAGAPPPGARVSLLVDASEPDQRGLAERLQVKLFDAGVRASVEVVDPARHRARVAAGDYDVALVSVRVQALRPALAAGQIAFAARGADAARRTMAALAGLEGDAALAAAARAGRDLDLVPLVASGVRASAAPALQGLSPRADGAVDPGALWLLGSRGLP